MGESWFKEGTRFMNAAAASGGAGTHERLLKGHFILWRSAVKKRKNKIGWWKIKFQSSRRAPHGSRAQMVKCPLTRPMAPRQLCPAVTLSAGIGQSDGRERSDFAPRIQYNDPFISVHTPTPKKV